MTITFDISADATFNLAADDSPGGTLGAAAEHSRVWLLKRNCALSPRQVLRFYLTLVFLSSLIGAGFACVGAWMVLPFTGLEMLALGAALLVYARHSTDHEKIILGKDGLVVEEVVAGRRSSISLNPCWVRVVVESGASAARTFGDAVFLLERGRRVAIGRYISERERRLFAGELKRALASPWAA